MMSAAYRKYRQYLIDMRLSERHKKWYWLRTETELNGAELMTDPQHGRDLGKSDKVCEESQDVILVSITKFMHGNDWLGIILAIVEEIPDAIIQELDKEYNLEKELMLEKHGEPNRISFTDFKNSRSSTWPSIDLERRRINEKIQIDDEHNLYIWNRPFVIETNVKDEIVYRKICKNGELGCEDNDDRDVSKHI